MKARRRDEPAIVLHRSAVPLPPPRTSPAAPAGTSQRQPNFPPPFSAALRRSANAPATTTATAAATAGRPPPGHLTTTTTTPSEFVRIALATGTGMVVMGFVGFFVKLIHIPINQIIVGGN